jgi:putative FmdB family regulatory protein
VPTYSYRCADCDHAFDIHQAFTDDNLTICPNCGGKLRKIFSPVGVSFSGSGFYRNDSRADAKSSQGKSKSDGSKSDGSKSDAPAKSDAAPKSDSSSSSSKSDSSSSSPAKTESKPAAKKEK